MTATQFRVALKRLKLSQRGAARLFKVDERTARRWALNERKVPDDVATKLKKLVEAAQ
jgi:DNA-binding transcriptional regulator YiaG